ncbi:aldose epimerase family protein [Nocardioides nanhaiensis]|uniref:Aldose 1-epimerase n=1 Tax=Nocardioides nanhaiensis TaxID=1476871 RepID=A0ABP8W9S6_9ACTN
MQTREFGQTAQGEPVHLLEVGRAPGVVLRLLTLGATVHGLELTGGDGIRRDVALAHPDVAAYEESGDYLGGTIGRYANRIALGLVELEGRTVRLGTHDRGHHLHGGPHGFDTRVWQVLDGPTLGHPDADPAPGAERVTLGLESPDGDQGYPGRMWAEVTFEAAPDGLAVWFAAVADAPTLANLTSHLYLNLEGAGSGTVDDHVLTVPAARYTPVDSTGIPLGEHEPVEGTPFDLRGGARIGDVVRSGAPQVVAARGLDHNLVPEGAGWREVARLASPRTRTAVVLSSDQPGLQVYTGNFLDGASPARGGGTHRQGDGVALEPQLHPDTPHRAPGPDWPSAVLLPGRTYRAALAWRVVVD